MEIFTYPFIVNGTIDAAVQGGINKYLDAFFTDEFIQQTKPEEMRDLKRFRIILKEQLKILNDGIEICKHHKSKEGKSIQLLNHLKSLLDRVAIELQNGIFSKELEKIKTQK